MTFTMHSTSIGFSLVPQYPMRLTTHTLFYLILMPFFLCGYLQGDFILVASSMSTSYKYVDVSLFAQIQSLLDLKLLLCPL
jgi:hypothetical protein